MCNQGIFNNAEGCIAWGIYCP